MSAIHAHVQTLAALATPATTLLAFDSHQLQRFPDPLADDADPLADDADPLADDAGSALELARSEQIALRLLERETRLALRQPHRDRYHAYHPAAAGRPAAWAVLLAPRAAAVRLYLSRADQRRFYRPQDPVPAPLVPPGTLLARWNSSSHAFSHITTDEQKHRVLFASTAHRHLYIPLDAPATALAVPLASCQAS